jgi:sugar phosphate isomerase/epimerase
MLFPDNESQKRRSFVKYMLAAPVIASTGILTASANAIGMVQQEAKKPSLKLSLNAYSFNRQLMDGSMSLDDMMNFCADKGLVAVDITAYYIPGYPNVPSDEVLYNIKRRAFSLGLEISGTGVRNDFTHADPAKRKESVQLVKNWIEAAQKLGAQTVRIFSGTQSPAGYTRAQIFEWMVKDIQECIDHGKSHGIVVALQNHDDFIKTADDTIEIMEALRSDWFGLMLDIGSFRTADPYEEIARTIKYAVTWQIKEKVFVRNKEVDVDPQKLMNLIKASGFRGYLPLETLGDGDPTEKISVLLDKFTRALKS